MQLGVQAIYTETVLTCMTLFFKAELLPPLFLFFFFLIFLVRYIIRILWYWTVELKSKHKTYSLGGLHAELKFLLFNVLYCAHKMKSEEKQRNDICICSIVLLALLLLLLFLQDLLFRTINTAEQSDVILQTYLTWCLKSWKCEVKIFVACKIKFKFASSVALK